MRIPPGRYSLGTHLDPSSTGDGADLPVMIFQPVIDLTGDTTVTFDARAATPISQSVPDRTAVAVDVGYPATTVVDGAPIIYGDVAADFSNARVQRLGGPIAGETSFTGSVTST